MIFFQDVLQACKLEKVEEITGIQMQEGEVEPKGETLVGPTGELLRPPGITIIYFPPKY